MLFNSFHFLVFFPIVVSIYFIIPKRIRYFWLLAASYYFYMSWNPKYIVLILFSTIITYLSGLIIEYINKNISSVKKQIFYKKLCVSASFSLNLLVLFLFKYLNFCIASLNIFLKKFNFEIIDYSFDYLLPVGISFFTFQALSYTIDVYRKKITPERNFIKYALFVSFFPQLVAGPIERSGKLITQIKNLHNIKLWDYERIKHGFMFMIWGFFLKLVISDRAAILVDYVYSNYKNYGFIEITLATTLFAFQIYCDFGGYTNIACGAAEIMGIDLTNNFKQPYLAQNIKDFWKRWHISLTTWFTDYLYIPLGGNRKGILRQYINITIVFLISGLWHGASWHYVVWGGLHAIYQIIGDLKNKAAGKLGFIKKNIFSSKLLSIISTFIITDFAWLFFRADSIKAAFNMIQQSFTALQSVKITSLGLDQWNLNILSFSILILFIVDILHENKIEIFKQVQNQGLWFRWLLYLGLFWFTILFGIYGSEYDTSSFIYFKF